MLTVDGVNLAIPPFSAAELGAVVRPLVDDLCARLEGTPRQHRCLVGICGPPGSGKSVLAARLLAYLPSAGRLPADEIAYLPLDGYHLPNRVLDERHYHGDRYPGADGRRLTMIKGAPETFDAETFARDLERCRAAGREARFPAYCRQAHDPVPGRIRVGPSVRLLLVEGNFLLLDGPWRGIGRLLDLSVYLSASRAQCEQNLLCRHVRGGRSAVSAREKIRCVDRVNHGLVERSRAQADYVVETADNRLTTLVPSARCDLAAGSGSRPSGEAQ